MFLILYKFKTILIETKGINTWENDVLPERLLTKTIYICKLSQYEILLGDQVFTWTTQDLLKKISILWHGGFDAALVCHTRVCVGLLTPLSLQTFGTETLAALVDEAAILTRRNGRTVV